MTLRKNLTTLVVVAVLVLALILAHILIPDQPLSQSERRPLQTRPTLGLKQVFSGQAMTQWESYLLDQFPWRDHWRTATAAIRYGLFGQPQHQGLIYHRGFLFQATPLKEEAAIKTIDKINRLIAGLHDTTAIFVCPIPDKGAYLTQARWFPVFDDQALENLLQTHLTDRATLVSIQGQLDAFSYYKTDLHWRQEALAGVVDRLQDYLGFDGPDTPFDQTLYQPFRGAYAGQFALPLPAEDLFVLSHEQIRQTRAQTYDPRTGNWQDLPLYDADLFNSLDPYSLFLGGPQALVRLDNPQAPDERTLVVFRDSFASSLAPLLSAGYRTIFLVDLRYMDSTSAANLLDVDKNTQVLFLYGSLVFNDDTLLKVA